MRITPVRSGWDPDPASGVPAEALYPDGLPPEWRLTYLANELWGVCVPRARWQAARPDTLAQWRQEVPARFRFFLACQPGDRQPSFTEQPLGERLGGWVCERLDAKADGRAGAGLDTGLDAGLSARPRQDTGNDAGLSRRVSGRAEVRRVSAPFVAAASVCPLPDSPVALFDTIAGLEGFVAGAPSLSSGLACRVPEPLIDDLRAARQWLCALAEAAAGRPALALMGQARFEQVRNWQTLIELLGFAPV